MSYQTGVLIGRSKNPYGRARHGIMAGGAFPDGKELFHEIDGFTRGGAPYRRGCHGTGQW
ncbi:hypothetical protein GCM10007207_12800 [Asaia siamensis]|uniref:Uncharacterized protein n=1 Tax=Asaia siamensis TaxID=110479 RepID=A0ABQ1LT88_9PROT|nr:hypothetical protein AA0323_0591 [Asaia siamensis NRIC 0323]GGC28763.1 hypothetical protein GCM10007207_12800 [Asaia siamensis]